MLFFNMQAYHSHYNRFAFISPSSKLFLLALLFLVACNGPHTPAAAQAKTDSSGKDIQNVAADMAGNFSDQTELRLNKNGLPDFFKKYPALASFKDKVQSFYTNRNFSFAWYDEKGQIEQAGSLYARLQNLNEEGVSAKIPYLNQLDSLIGNEANDVGQKTETELLLTGLYFYFAEKVWGGLDEKSTTKIEWYLPRKKLSYENWLDSLLKTSDGFTNPNEPVYRQYRLLKPFLERYRNIEKNNQWQTIAAEKKSYQPGDSSKIISQLRKKLFLLGDLTNDSGSPLFDTALVRGVKNFQHRYGWKEDGIIREAMIRDLNQPVQKKIEKIIVNMERSRWLPAAVKGEYMAVNIPEFKLHIYNDDSLLWDMNVVVGKSVNKTVIFSGDLKYVVFSPYWNIPTSIVKKEVLPGIKKNKNYLAAHHMEQYAGGFRQKPGPWNSLGRVKFLFPNSYSIYLHDTPSKSLFQEDKRAFSHGCIRVAEPKKLAAYLLRKDPSWTDEKITQAMNSGTEKYVTLKNEIPVFITYFTAWVDRQGNINFRDDVYSRDNRLAAMLMNNQ